MPMGILNTRRKSIQSYQLPEDFASKEEPSDYKSGQTLQPQLLSHPTWQRKWEKSHKAPEEKNKDTPGKKTIKKEFNKFIDMTSVHGLPQIVNAKHMFSRVLWTLAVIICFTVFIVNAVLLITKFYQRPVETKVTVSFSKRTSFPSVTVCNLNPVRLSQVKRNAAFSDALLQSLPELVAEMDESVLRVKTELGDQFFSTLANTSTGPSVSRKKRELINVTVSPNVITSDSDVKRKYWQEYAKLDSDDRISLGHQLGDFVVGCNWNGNPCTSGNFYHFQTYRLGNCYTFNHGKDKDTHNISKSGPAYGLTLSLNIEQYEYVPAITDTAGVKVVIHSQNSLPYPANEGMTIAPGFATNIGIRKRVIERQPDPWGNCTKDGVDLYSPDGFIYSVKACLMECLHREIKTQCGCRYPSLPSDDENLRVCDDLSWSNDEKCYKAIHDKHIADTLGCRCPEACIDEQYQVDVSTAKWPAVNNREKWETRIAEKNSALKLLIATGTEYAQAENNFAQLKVFYQELNLEETIQVPAYSSEGLLGDIGGQLGLWVGLSVLTLFECVEFVWVAGSIAFRKAQRAIAAKKVQGIEKNKPPTIRLKQFN